MRMKSLYGVTAGGHGDRLRADNFAAGDVVRRVADHEHALRPKTHTAVFAGPAQCVGAKLVTLLGVVGECSDGEWRPKPEVSEFDFSTLPEVAGEQALGDVAAARDFCDDVRNAGQDVRVGVLDFFGQGFKVAIKKTSDVFRSRCTEVLREYCTGDPHISAAKIFKPGECVLDGESAFERETQGAFARATRVNQCAVNVPEKKRFHSSPLASRGVLWLASPCFLPKIMS